MKNALGVIVALCAVALLAVPARAAEAYLGVVTNADAGTGTAVPSNLTTAVPFIIPPATLLTIQPSVAAYVCVDVRGGYDAGTVTADGGAGPWVQYVVPSCSSTTGVKVAADTAFPSSCAPANRFAMPDGGISSCSVACVPVSGVSASCPVWSRSGREF